MKKVWVYNRKGIKGWWVGWYEGGKRKAKVLPTKTLAEHFQRIKYSQLNSDVFTGTVIVDWRQMIEEYRENKTVEGLTEASLYEISLTLKRFHRQAKIITSKQLTQHNLDRYILERGKEVKRATLNKDIRNLKAFIHWCEQKKYTNGNLKIKLLKEEDRPVKSLYISQTRQLLSVTESDPAVYMRILLALGTGLRRGDIEAIKVSDIDFVNNCITTNSRKTKKTIILPKNQTSV